MVKQMRLGDSWSCHVCGAIRYDKFISVYKRTFMYGGTIWEENIRHCNDVPACVDGAGESSSLRAFEAGPRKLVCGISFVYSDHVGK
jgi:hypothetical protein